MYVDFVLGKHVNYFDILEYQGIGIEMPQQHPNFRHIDPNLPVPVTHRWIPKTDVSPAHQLV